MWASQGGALLRNRLQSVRYIQGCGIAGVAGVSKVISIVNMKGGVGKTTLAVALTDYIGCVLQQNVCLVDLDAQANASYAVLGEERFEALIEQNATIDRFFLDQGKPFKDDSLDDYILDEASRLEDGGGRVSLVPSNPRLRMVERSLLIKLARLNVFDQELEGRAGSALRRGFADLTGKGTYVVVDSPPGISGFAMAALKASDIVVAPVNPDYLSAIGLDLLGREIIPRLRPEERPPLWACRTKIRPGVHYPRMEKFSDPAFQDTADFSLMNTVIQLRADLGRIVEEGELFQSFRQKYGTAIDDVISFGEEVMSLVDGER